ncbi:hypothetical protein LNP17_16315 [Klebsiella variicola subsp. variicola]|nr:hypothetical protein [Klebsiella variicola subsp. variicola]
MTRGVGVWRTVPSSPSYLMPGGAALARPTGARRENVGAVGQPPPGIEAGEALDAHCR